MNFDEHIEKDRVDHLKEKALRYIKSLPRGDRLDVMDDFCRNCGSDYPYCEYCGYPIGP